MASALNCKLMIAQGTNFPNPQPSILIAITPQLSILNAVTAQLSILNVITPQPSILDAIAPPPPPSILHPINPQP